MADGHSSQVFDASSMIQAYWEAGIDSIDCADIYTGVEDTIWEYISQQITRIPRIHTKHVPDLESIRTRQITPENTRLSIERSLKRLQIKKLDLVQFHHWDYAIDTYKISLSTLLEMQYEGKIWAIGVTNSSVHFLEKLRLELGFIPLTTQNQYNIIDRRVEYQLQEYSSMYDIAIYAYGSLMWWLLSERYFWENKPIEPLENRSLRKYLRVIDDWWDWDLFQDLLFVLSNIAQKYSVSISDIAMRWVLERKWVSAIIVGARHSRYAHLLKNVFTFTLSKSDFDDIDAIYLGWYPLKGDVFDLERNEPRHRDIMKFNLNKAKG